jgi:hypothetical protein
MAYGRRPSLRRLDLMVLGASPDKLAARREIPAVNVPDLDDEQQDTLYRLNYRHQWPGNNPLTASELVLRQRLIRLAQGAR